MWEAFAKISLRVQAKVIENNQFQIYLLPKCHNNLSTWLVQKTLQNVFRGWSNRDLEGFQIRWGNQNKIIFIGLGELKVSLMAQPNIMFPVPFLVKPENIEHLILDANVVYNKEFLQNYFINCIWRSPPAKSKDVLICNLSVLFMPKNFCQF